MIQTVTEQNIENFVQTQPLVILDFWADWCAPCRIMTPMITELHEQLANQFGLGTVDVADQVALAEQYAIQSVPTLLIFKNGQATEKVTGAFPKEKLKRYLDKKIAEMKSAY
ncbi:thioredoxin [Lactobacillus curvatus]|uniref:thioredoxin n=1 Tax=Latilactobacillus fragifolii TaxID=2814244 RepID=UPI0012AF47B8|nr:thioredoxin [Latilactobacillus fragifolii]MSD84125.1 thioredoxin [Latilactobacillus curvatus]MSE24445.1 thioredoxin [Latilactobacillus curvatus]